MRPPAAAAALLETQVCTRALKRAPHAAEVPGGAPPVEGGTPPVEGGAPPVERPVPRVHHPLEPRRGGAEVTAVAAVKRFPPNFNGVCA